MPEECLEDAQEALPALRRWQRLGATLASAAARVARAPLGHRMHRGLASLQRRGARDAATPDAVVPVHRPGGSFLCTGRVRPGGFTLALPTPPRPHSLPCPWVVLSALSLILPLPLGAEPAPSWALSKYLSISLSRFGAFLAVPPPPLAFLPAEAAGGCPHVADVFCAHAPGFPVR